MSCGVCDGAGVIASCPECHLAFAPSDCPKNEQGQHVCPICAVRAQALAELVEVNLSVCGVCKGTGD